ncbi:PIG-L family deacetylase [Chitinophaga oryziterrae]|uniref:PIG-L family deacetylase n=1 Tax=Chitinophaga oryziterrae TaxID=1031224 RepID=A0A6N8JC24_9BACT|nr:PIG-L deacetylase family protein [Chitinophaga oryziterrae]MVT42091.1 PIG-L family deacetylase [Chitinophaga oryziterrae]
MNDSIILSVTAHPDDEVLGFGASAAKFASNGSKVYNCILSGDVDARRHRPDLTELYNDACKAQYILGCEPPILGTFPNIKFNTVPHLEMVQFIEKVIEEVQPDYIFTHHPYDLNNDHYHVSKACQAASRLFQRKPVKRIKGLYFMEVLSSTDWSFPVDGNNFQPNAFVEIGQDFLAKKLKALEAYRGVMRPYPHPRSVEVVKGIAAYRGGQSGTNYAEAFQCVFQLLDI